MLLRGLLEQYAEDHDIALNISEAINGLEATMAAESEHFSLILMDIMMPEMDGIEATKRIRFQDAKTMIVAVSAVDDGDRQQQILRNGAEDYISKPINGDIFLTRLGNYFSLIESRETTVKKFNPSAANLFTQETFSRKLLFYIQSDDELAEFWEYYLLDSNERSESLSDAIRTVCAMASVGLKVGLRMQVIVEESIEKMFITLSGLGDIDAKLIKLTMAKNPSVTDYKNGGGKLSIRLMRPRLIVPIKPAEEHIATTVSTPAATTNVPPAVMVNVVPTVTYEAVEETIQVYDYMDTEGLEELKEFVGKLNSLMLIVGGEIEPDEVDEISANLQQISRIASGYTNSYAIGQALASIGYTISNNRSIFMEKANALAPMCAAFGRDLNSWIQLIFVEGATSVNYMDDTIIANAQMIASILTMDDANAGDEIENLDDIFDF